MASRCARMPALRIQPRTSSAAARCSGVRKIRVRDPGVSEIAASSLMRPTISAPSGPVVPLFPSFIRFRSGADLDRTTPQISQANSTDYPSFLSALKGLIECSDTNPDHDARDGHVTYSV